RCLSEIGASGGVERSARIPVGRESSGGARVLGWCELLRRANLPHAVHTAAEHSARGAVDRRDCPPVARKSSGGAKVLRTASVALRCPPAPPTRPRAARAHPAPPALSDHPARPPCAALSAPPPRGPRPTLRDPAAPDGGE